MTTIVVLLLLLLAAPAVAQTPPTGFSNLTGPDWVQAGGVATGGVSFGYTRWTAGFGPNQQAGCIISALPNEGETLHILFRFETMENRIRLILTRMPGTDNDTLTLGEVVGNVTRTMQGPISLGKDIQVLDRVGIDVVGNVINGNYWSIDPTWAEWRTVVSGVASRTPDLSYIGLGGATPAACTQFFGQGDTATADTTIPAPDPPTGAAVTTFTESSISLTADLCTDTPGVTGYLWYRCDGTASPGCTPTTLASTTPGVAYTDTGRTANTNYRYCMKCTDGTNTSTTCSNVANATTLAVADTTAPSAPGALSITGAPRVMHDPSDAPAVKVNVAAPATDAVTAALTYVTEMGTLSDCSDCAIICQTDYSAFPLTLSTADDASCIVSLAYGMTRYVRTRAIDAAQNTGAYTSIVGFTTPASYHTAVPAQPTVVAKPTVVQKPANVSDPPVP